MTRQFEARPMFELGLAVLDLLHGQSVGSTLLLALRKSPQILGPRFRVKYNGGGTAALRWGSTVLVCLFGVGRAAVAFAFGLLFSLLLACRWSLWFGTTAIAGLRVAARTHGGGGNKAS